MSTCCLFNFAFAIYMPRSRNINAVKVDSVTVRVVTFAFGLDAAQGLFL